MSKELNQLEKGYGSSVVKRLSADLKQEFPNTTGFSPRNLWDMKRFYEFYALADEKVRQQEHKIRKIVSYPTDFVVKNLLY